MTAEVQLVTEDIELVAIVGARLASLAPVRVVSMNEAGLCDGDVLSVVLVDVRKQITPASIRRLRMRHPRALFVAVVSTQHGPRELYVEGAHAVVSADGRAIASCCSVLFQAPRFAPDTRATATR